VCVAIEGRIILHSVDEETFIVTLSHERETLFSPLESLSLEHHIRVDKSNDQTQLMICESLSLEQPLKCPSSCCIFHIELLLFDPIWKSVHKPTTIMSITAIFAQPTTTIRYDQGNAKGCQMQR
jgi:hypothetical protein